MIEWQNVFVQIRSQLEIVDTKLKQLSGSPEKPKKMKNYALKKVEEPPSDNE